MNNTKEVNKNELEFLRKHTTLSPVAVVKIRIEKVQAEANRRAYHKAEPNEEYPELDLSGAEKMEYDYRKEAWEKSWEKEWRKNPDGLSLSEFAQMAMESSMREERGRQ